MPAVLFSSPLPPLPSLFSPVWLWFVGSWESKKASFGVVAVKMGKSSGATFSKIQVDIASKCCQMVKNDRILADERPFQHFLAILAHFMPIIIASKCCQMVKNDRILADERPFQHFLAILAHFMPIIIASKCCQMVKNDRILADERPFQHFLAILAHFMPIYTRIFENGTARLRCPSGVSRALFCRSETISKVGNIKIMSASSPFFFSPLSPPFSFLSRVVCRLMGVQKTQFRCRCGENGQIFRSHLFKNPGRYCKQMLPDGEK